MCRSPACPCSSGFTLIELVAVLVLAGILAVVALPRFTETTTYSVIGFYDQTLAALRYAQKIAIAQRRWTRLADTGGGLALTYCGYSGGDGCNADTSACTQALVDPASGQAYTLVPPADVALSHDAGYGTEFFFNCLGQPVSAAGTALGTITYTVSGDGNHPIVVEQETGYAHP
jgi:MSHA pilin protein MshC